ncbi:MAG: glycosyltransferase [Solirubrobacteraceae bacterium]
MSQRGGDIWSGRRVAIVHDWFQGFHGSERVVDVMLSDVFAQASCDVFTFQAAREVLPPRLRDAIVRESRLAGLPGIRQRGHAPGRWRYLLPYMPRYFRSLDLDGYDLVVASSHACAVHAAAASTSPSLCYCYTPMRYAWMPSTDGERVAGVKALAIRASTHRLRRADRAAAQQAGPYAAISTAVRDRIHRCYGLDAEVIHPPVDHHEFVSRIDKQAGHFLWVHRLVAYKHPEVVIEAFRGLPYRLTMVGIGPLEETVRAHLPDNVRLLGWLSRGDLIKHYQRATGFLHVGEEDFGITIAESLAAGTPVIALRRGGACDIVRDGQDGVLIDEPTVAEVRSAVERLASTSWDSAALTARAAEFSRERFVDRFGEFAARAAAG